MQDRKASVFGASKIEVSLRKKYMQIIVLKFVLFVTL